MQRLTKAVKEDTVVILLDACASASSAKTNLTSFLLSPDIELRGIAHESH